MDYGVGPLVSIILPVFNGELYLRDAIQSILDQSYKNFELLIFNDGSTDSSQQMASSFSDERIRIYSENQNRGYVTHLNNGIAVARGKYIARMDADDISGRERLKTQVDFLESFPEVGICGTFVTLIDETGRVLGKGHHFVDDDMLRIRLLANSCFAHPSVMFRKAIVESNNMRYDHYYAPAEDYKLWFDLSLKTKLANIPIYLLKYRIHGSQVTQKQKDLQSRASDAIRRMAIESFFGHPINNDAFAFHNTLFKNDFLTTKEYVMNARKWLLSLIAHNRSVKLFNEELFERHIGETWFSLCTCSYRLGFWIIWTCFRTKLGLRSIPIGSIVRFLAKSVIKYSPAQ